MKKIKITLEDAKAELRDAATGPDCQNWRYSPAVKELLNSHDELLVALGEMKQRAEAAEQRLQPIIPTLGSLEVNEAAWKLHDMLTEHGPLNGHQFNNLKGCFYEALKVCMVPNKTLQPAIIDVVAERQRQISAEGWTPEHDDGHASGSIAHAAGCYALNGHDEFCEPGYAPEYWPWEFSDWKPTSPRRNLVKAGALILAEIERIDRAAAKVEGE